MGNLPDTRAIFSNCTREFVKREGLLWREYNPIMEAAGTTGNKDRGDENG